MLRHGRRSFSKSIDRSSHRASRDLSSPSLTSEVPFVVVVLASELAFNNRNDLFNVWIYLGAVGCGILFQGHYDFDICLQFQKNRVWSISLII